MMWNSKYLLTTALACLALLLTALQAEAVRIGDLCDVQGVRGNILKGQGIIVGLAGTGDNAAAAVRAQERMLKRLTIDIDSTGELSTDNSAVVMVTATLPPFAKEGTRIDVQVSSLYDSESLEGGILMNTHLTGDDGRVYAVAQGPISTGGFNANATGAAARQNHVTVGRVPNGAYVEREVPSTYHDGGRLVLMVRQPDFVTANNIQKMLNTTFGLDSAYALGAGAIKVNIPAGEKADIVAFVAKLLEIDVSARQPARVVINERTGTIVIGGTVGVKPCQVAHGNITITVAATPVIAQPAPLAQGDTVVTQVTDLNVTQDDARFNEIKGSTAADVAKSLNTLKVPPRDMISIFQALREAGALDAELEIM
jgi:flagellar P-ring protein precursor FlgI